MMVTVYGAGAIGGITGAALARAGHDVLLVDSHVPHVEAINAYGLTVERRGEAETTRVSAVTPAALGRDLELTDNLWGYKWAKLVYGALLFATAAVDAHVYDVVERSDGVQRALVGIVGEGMAVADKAGVRLLPFDEFDPAWYRAAAGGDAGARRRAMAAIAAHYRAHTKTKTGIWRDLAVRKRPTEVDGQLGALAAKGEALGVAMPLTRRLIDLIRDLEAGRRQMDWANLDELVALVPGARA